MTSLKYHTDSGSELPEEKSHEDASEASTDDAGAGVHMDGQITTVSPHGDLDRVQAERLIEEIEAAGSSRDESIREKGSTAILDTGGTFSTPGNRRSADAHASGFGSTPEASPESPKPEDEHQWILPSILVALTIGLGIFFLVNFSEYESHPLGAEGTGVPERMSRAELVLDSTTRSKLAELNRRVIFWTTRDGDGFDPYKVTLKRVREDLNLSSDQMLDSWGRPIKYEVAGGRYTLRSSGPDKTFNTDDDLVELQPQLPSKLQPALASPW